MRLLPQRHNHDHEGAAAPHAFSFRSGDPRSAALQSLPLRRACRNHASGDAGRRSSGRGARLMVVLGDTSEVPNQGATIASETIQITAVPLRKAAAQARQFLIARAAERLELPAEELSIEDGLIRGKDNRSVSYGELIEGDSIRLELADA